MSVNFDWDHAMSLLVLPPFAKISIEEGIKDMQNDKKRERERESEREKY